GPVIFANLDDVSLMRQYPMPSRIMASSPHGATTKNNEAYWIGPQGGFVTSGVTVDEFTQQILGLFPTSVSAGGLEFDTYGTLYIILNYGAFSSNYGKIVDLEWTGLTSSFSSEYGKIVRISSSDTWTFTSEYGRVVGISVGGDRPASTIVRTQRGDDIIWSLDSDQVNCIAHNPAERQTYIGKDDGVYKAFNGDRKNWVWQSVYSSLGMPAHRKQLHKVRIRCSGTVVVAIYTDDDVLIHSETITNDAMQVSDIVMPPASWGYTFSIRLEGSTDGVVEPPVVYWFTPEVL
ncbi:MAG TPA: hypothetical protein PLI21_07965, partial [Methanomassiliicoccaceae archaeon]|nr:hypothetical protein [Methanomassiliicoccaceae archaeon]